MANYELSFLMPNLVSRQREEIIVKIESEIKRLGGKVEDKFIEKKMFAYPVKKYQDGFLGVVNFSLESRNLREINNFLRLNKDLLRVMVEKQEKVKEDLREDRKFKKPVLAKKQIKKVKIEELDKKLDEMLK